jgi:hypothetical protein
MPLKEMMQINYDEIGENAISIVYELLKITSLPKKPEHTARFIEVLHEFMKNEKAKKWSEQDLKQKTSRKNFYYRLFLAVNCLQEIVNHHLNDVSEKTIDEIKDLL